VFSKVNGTPARRDVSVMRFSSARMPFENELTARSICASSACARSGVIVVESAVSSPASPRTTTGSWGPTTAREAASARAVAAD
jgi:hypothetical protein